MQEGILRVGGHTCNAPVEYNAKHPAILPVESHLSRLIIRSDHDLVGHAGLGHTFTALKERFWVLKGSTSIRQVIADCFVFRRINAIPAVQKMADLPNLVCRCNSRHFSIQALIVLGLFRLSKVEVLSKGTAASLIVRPYELFI